ncbi:MAG: hypothetical protein F4Y77_18340 [Holophagales bacterium]|nr:hypothetical protein [Holophagales bacterium]
MLHIPPPIAAVIALASALPLAAQDAHILRLDASVDAVWQLNTRVRHTTVITLPASENILDFVVGDLDYWHLSGSANVAFLKPTEPGVKTNIALVCESGRIYPFLVSESSETPPHLVVRFDPAEPDLAAADGEAHRPAFVAADQVASYQSMARAAAEAAADHRRTATEEIAAAKADAADQVNGFRAEYPTRVRFPYRLQEKAKRWPFLVEGMWHDGQFTYLRSLSQESPALYERKDGQPSLIPYDLTEDGLYVVRRVIGDGWLQIGKQRVTWTFDEPDPLH